MPQDGQRPARAKEEGQRNEEREGGGEKTSRRRRRLPQKGSQGKAGTMAKRQYMDNELVVID